MANHVMTQDEASNPHPTASSDSAKMLAEPRRSEFSIFGLSGRPLIAALVGWFFVVFDGYDLIVYGTVQSHIMEEWGLTPAQAGTLGSTAFLGMMIGAVALGRISDAMGRKFAIIFSVVVLSIFTILCAFSHHPVLFGIFRLFAGFGLGGLVPSVNAMVSDLAPVRYRALWATWTMSGVPIGGSIAAVVAIFVVPTHDEWGWRFMFLFAAIPLIIGLPLALKTFPQQENAAAEAEKAAKKARPGFGSLFSLEYRFATVMFVLATVFTLLAWYGLGTWLPKLMQQSGYNFGAALVFTLVLNLGAVIGSFITGWIGDTFGPLRSAIISASVAAVALFCLLLHPPVGLVYIILVLAGVGTHGTQVLIIAAIATYYPQDLRGTGLGFALGFGRIGAVAAPQLAGLLLGLQWANESTGVASNYVLFAGSAAVSAVLLTLLSLGRRRSAHVREAA